MSAAGHRAASRRAVAVVLVVAVAAAVTTLALRTSPAPRSDGSGGEPPLTVERSITPGSALFGDRVEAVIEISSADRRVEPGSVRVEAGFAPYLKAAESTTRSSDGGVTVRRVRIALDCLGDDCLAPRGGARAFRFPPATVSFRLDGEPRTLAVPWGEVRVASRLGPGRAVLAEEPPRVDAGLTVAPGRARAVLAVLAAVLAVIGAWLLLSGLRPRHAFTRWRRRRMTPLERALEQLAAAARNGDEAAHRRALDLVATRLEEVDAPGLEQRSRRLAWERTPPEPAEIVTLGEQVRAGVGGGRR